MRKLALFSLIIFLFSCSSIQVAYDYDKNVDFSKYKTYGYTEESLKLPLNQLNLQRMIDAVDTAMKTKGFTESKDADIAVDLHLKTQKQVEATATTTGAGYGPYRYRWGGGMATTQVNYNEYTDGTLFISFIDMKTNKLVWQGTGTGRPHSYSH